jgi:hypothetical protein
MANPALRKLSYQVEGVTPVPSVAYVPFQGGMDLSKEIHQLPLASYSDIQNMRPMRPGFMKRKGMGTLHTVADGTNKAVTMGQFSKGRSSNVATFAQMSDGDYRRNGHYGSYVRLSLHHVPGFVVRHR